MSKTKFFRKGEKKKHMASVFTFLFMFSQSGWEILVSIIIEDRLQHGYYENEPLIQESTERSAFPLAAWRMVLEL